MLLETHTATLGGHNLSKQKVTLLLIPLSVLNAKITLELGEEGRSWSTSSLALMNPRDDV